MFGEDPLQLDHADVLEMLEVDLVFHAYGHVEVTVLVLTGVDHCREGETRGVRGAKLLKGEGLC